MNMVTIGNAQSSGMITNNTVVYYQTGGFFMPKNKFQDVVFTIIMATIMVYGMVVYNVSLNMGGVTNQAFVEALKELPIMVPIAFILEFFIVGKVARALAFTVVTPKDRPQIITYAISICICCIMCPVMSFIAMMLFKDDKSFGTWIQTWGMNFPVAILYQMFYCGPLCRLIFRCIFREKKAAKENTVETNTVAAEA
jgi:hypothetical protein